MFDDSHILILAGQVKVKGQLSSMAKCLENPDQSISDMCRLFFAELATKDNAIYNGFIDIFSGLSNDETLAKDEMKRIIRFLVGFIDKEKHQKQLAESCWVAKMSTGKSMARCGFCVANHTLQKRCYHCCLGRRIYLGSGQALVILFYSKDSIVINFYDLLQSCCYRSIQHMLQ